MEEFSTNNLRKEFLRFFQDNDHEVLPSSSLVPHNDPSLMFTNSGMVQFKNYFTGKETPKFTKITTCQKCVRAGGKHNDLENVGHTPRHHTFFEMLGNFSFGAYFKEYAIEMAWKFLTEILKIDKNKLIITIYYTDNEAEAIWKNFVDDSRIHKVNSGDNLWSMGATGPYGKCSEIFYDHGELYDNFIFGESKISKQGVEGGRYVEIWNLVFMEEEKLSDGTSIILPKKAIDTGMGLERIAAVVQGVYSNFHIDIFKKLITALIEILSSTRDERENLIKAIKSGFHFSSGACDGKNINSTSSMIVADHLRSSSFLISDGVMPSNEGRGYVLRRIIRRAVREIYAMQKDLTRPVLSTLVPVLVNEMQDAYPELRVAQNTITEVLKNEEEKFKSTISNGLELLNPLIDDIKKRRKDKLSGEMAFKLYDTHGFPLDLTKDVLSRHSIEVDEERFNELMAEQRAQSMWKGSGERSEDKIWFDIYDKYGSTEFWGYNMDTKDAKILAIVKDGKMVNEIGENEECVVVLNETPFYGEKGGQIGDTGQFVKGDCKHTVTDTRIYADNRIYGHHLVTQGSLKVEEEVTAKVDIERRKKIRANHSATHLLNSALRKTLGSHIAQRGSFVNDEKLRFDFTSSRALTEEEISQIEESVNAVIIKNEEIETIQQPHYKAIEEGALSLFGEKYSEDVRVVSMGKFEDSYSKELCGGTHAERTGDIGVFKIIKEESIAAGVRRIEACTGIAAMKLYQKKFNVIKTLNNLLQCNDDDLQNKLENIIKEKKRLIKLLEESKIETILLQNHAMSGKLASGEIVILCNIEQCELDTLYLRRIADKLALKYDNVPAVIAVLSSKDSKENEHNILSMIIRVTDKSHLKANDIVLSIIGDFGGRGGGNAKFAQVGGIMCKSYNLLFEKWR